MCGVASDLKLAQKKLLTYLIKCVNINNAIGIG